MSEYDFRTYGIEPPVLLLGTVTPILRAQGLPVVFLFDENHGSNECIEQNVANAKELMGKANVTVIGVESHQGGCEWDDYNGCYYTDRFHPGTDLEPVNACSTFADCLRAAGANVVGVECLGMSNQQECDFAPGCKWFGRPAREHPLNIERSKHFLKTLLELWRSNGAVGNMILNSGGDHISHIENWVRDGTAETLAGQKAIYLHVRVPAYEVA